MRNLSRQLKLSGSVAALAAAVSIGSSPAYAQAQTAQEIEQVVVTGTSIRGVAPVGSNLVTMGPKDIEETGATDVMQVLADAPSIEGFGNSGQATATSSNGGPGIAIYIHQLGANGSGSTLVLMDGHRVVQSGVTNYFVDGNTIPGVMLERVDVLAEGASSVYGSDAVAGVVNFITRKEFEGFQISASGTFEQGATNKQVNVLVGHDWDSGNFILGMGYAVGTVLKSSSRPWTFPSAEPANAVAAGIGATLTNSQIYSEGFNCSPATLQLNGSGNVYLSPQTTTNVTNSAQYGICDANAYGAILPSSVRETSMLKITQKFGSKLTFGFDIIVDQRDSQQPQSRGSITATVFQTGPQKNPFYTNPPGVSTTVTKQTIKFEFDDLLGPGAISYGGDAPIQLDASLDYNIDDNWTVDLQALAGKNDAFTASKGTISSPNAFLAINGTAQSGGSTTTSDIPTAGLSTISLFLPLTTSNALDVWSPTASNLTQPAVLKNILNNNTISHGIYGLVDVKLTAQGTLMTLPAGPVKVAFGGERLMTHIEEIGTKAASVAGSNYSSAFADYDFYRKDDAEFVEADIPLVSPDMGIPFMQKFEVDLALRHDLYNDFGATTNPKGSFNWDVIDGLRIRANWSTSFVAPPLNLVGYPLGVANFSGTGGATGPGILKVAFYPAATAFGVANCPDATGQCNLSTLQGISRGLGDPTAIAQKGRGWTAGFDFTPDFIPGLFLAATYWNVELLGGMTGPPFSVTVNTPSLINNIQLFPCCATPAQIAAWTTSIGGVPLPQTSVFPSCAQYFSEGETANYLYMYVSGVDLQLNYRINTEDLFGTDFGTLTIGSNATITTKFDDGFSYKVAPNPNQIFTTLNTVGLNTSFPTLAQSMRTHFGWTEWGVSADLYWNHSGAYKNVNTTVITPIVNNSFGVYSGAGGDHVKAHESFDLHLGYAFDGGMLGDDSVGLEITDLLATHPPFFLGSSSYDSLDGNPIGRTFGVTLRAKL